MTDSNAASNAASIAAFNTKHMPLVCPAEDEDVAVIGDCCPNCGGSMIGDGVCVPRRCEYADSDVPTEAEHDAFMEEFEELCDKLEQKNAEEKRKEDFARQENIVCALSALCLLVLVVIPFIVFGEV